MVHKRARLEIYLDILQALNRGINKPTRLMYATNLSWRPLQEVLNSMIHQELVNVKSVKRRKLYEITEKGKECLSFFERAKKLIEVPSKPSAMVMR